jgi:hypothetical protein
MLVIFQLLPKTPFKKEHKYGNNYKENKKICAITLLIPYSESFKKKKGCYE